MSKIETNQYVIFKMGAECNADAQAIRAVFLPWLMNWKETRINLECDGVLHARPDVTVEFSIVERGPSVGEMLWLIDCIGNCHMAGDTLATIDNFTGERTFRDEFDFPAQRPSKEIMAQAITAVATRQRNLNLEVERTLQLHRTYVNAGRLGDKWNPGVSEDFRPGWVVTVQHEIKELISVRLISTPLGCKKSDKKGDLIANRRLLTINA